jgi:CRP-like cAMP-binding protein
VQKVYQQGEVIVEEGETGLGWFILKNGRVGVFKGEMKVAEFDQPGAIFGELSGILNRPRTATLKAVEASEVVCIECTLSELIHQQPAIARKILVNLAERLVSTTDSLWGTAGSDGEKSHMSGPTAERVSTTISTAE